MSFSTDGSMVSNPTLALNKNQNTGLFNQPQQNLNTGITLPSSSTVQNTGLVSNSGAVLGTQTVGTNPGILNQQKPDTTYTHSTTTNQTGGTSTKPTPNPSVLKQQQDLNAANINTPGYVPLVTDGLAGPKTAAALAQYGNKLGSTSSSNPTTITPPPTTTPATTPPVGAGGAATGTANNGGTGVNQGILIGNLADKSQNASPGYIDAVNKYGTIAGQLEALKSQEAQQTSDINQSGTWTSRAMGEQGQANIQNAATEAALGSQLTAQGNLVNAANTQQGLQVTAGTNAANANAPITGVPYGTQTITPSAVQPNGSSSQVQPSDPYYKTLQNYAQMAANGQYGAIPSSVTGNAVLNDQMNQMAKEINPSYNPVTSSAQSGISTAQTQNVATMTASYKSATNLGSQLKDLITTYGVNPSDLNAANLAIQKVAQNTSSPQYQALNNLVTDIVATYSSILTPGSSTDTARATAASLLNDSASGKSLITTLNNLDDQAKAKIAGQTTSYGENPGGSSTGGTMFGSFFSK